MFASLRTTLCTLPVMGIIDDVCNGIDYGTVTIINSETSSGKTLLVPALVHDATNAQILVLEPRRPLAIQAAETVAMLSDTRLGIDVGYAVGTRGHEDQNRVSFKTNRVIYATYGYALNANLISEADIIICDEVHDPAMDISLVLSLIKNRLKQQDADKVCPAVFLMSATLNDKMHREYWSEFNPRVFSIPPASRYKCVLEKFAGHTHEAAYELLARSHDGIMVFLEGAAEIDDARQKFEELLVSVPLDHDVMVASVTGRSSYEERTHAWAAPDDGCKKVLFCTNVAESGFNLPWVNAGVTCGSHKELMVTRSGTVSLQTVPLSQDRVVQQMGRTNRFSDSVFLLCGTMEFKEMEKVVVPDILRLPLTSLVMHCAGLEIDPFDLEFMPALKSDALHHALDDLRKLGFIDTTGGAIKLTEDGHFIEMLPVGLEAGALLCHARKLDILGEALLLASVYEVGNLWQRFKDPVACYSDVSEVFANLEAYAEARKIMDEMGSYREAKKAIDEMNISNKRVKEVLDVLQATERVLRAEGYLTMPADTLFDPSGYEDLRVQPKCELYDKFRQCLLAANVLHLARWSPFDKVRTPGSYNSIQVTNSSAVRPPWTPAMISVRTREIKPRDEMRPSFIVAEQLTVYEDSDIEAFGKIRPEVFSRRVGSSYDPQMVEISAFDKAVYILKDLSIVLPPPEPVKAMIDAYRPSIGSILPIRRLPDDDRLGGMMQKRPREADSRKSLGEILQEVLERRTAYKADAIRNGADIIPPEEFGGALQVALSKGRFAEPYRPASNPTTALTPSTKKGAYPKGDKGKKFQSLAELAALRKTGTE